jgi:hypothetical protein
VTSLNGLRGDLTLAAGTDLTLTPSGQTLTLVANSASANTANTLVRRDGSGSFSAGTITGSLTGNVTGNVTGAASANVLKAGDTMTGALNLNPGNINLTPSSASSGHILKNGSLFLHNFGTNNTFVGQNAGNVTMTGTSNTASGAAALLTNTTGGDNTAIGSFALAWNTTGTSNTASGSRALNSNTTGGYNTASGIQALYINTTGHDNTATGGYALWQNTTGDDNTANGTQALYFNTTGHDNTAAGVFALGNNTTGEYNTASGVQALYSNTTGSSNTASGINALYGNTTGSDNTALGVNALLGPLGLQNTAVGSHAGARTGSGTGYTGGTITFTSVINNYNTFVGYNTGTTKSSVFNCTAVGIDAYCDGDNQVRLGNTFVSSIGGKVGWSALSDLRAKTDLREVPLGLDFVLGLRPVAYRLRNGNGRLDMGFVAQDVEALLGDGYNVVDVGGDEDRTLSLRYTDLIAPLVKAVQEQQREISELKKKLASLEAERLATSRTR